MAQGDSARPRSTAHRPRLADHSTDWRMLVLAAMALVTGTGGAGAAWVLLHASLPVISTDMPANLMANLMISEQTGRICVVNDKGELAGIVARRDLLRSRAAVLHGEVKRER